MYCKKCGTEQKEGQKFCPKCGTPYIDLEQEGVVNSNKDSILDVREKTGKPVGKEQPQEQKNENQDNFTRPLNPNEERKVMRIAKAGMWIILIAIVLTFVRTGFGFSFWWYLYLVIMAIIALIFWITVTPNSNGENRLKSADATFVNLLSWVGAIMLGILYLWGPLNSDYQVSGDDSDSYRYEQSSSSEDSDKAPSWIQGTWYCVTPYGNMQVEIVGDHIREIPGDGSSYYGTYHIQGDAIMPETGSQMYYQMDFDKKRLSAGQGYYFRKQ